MASLTFLRGLQNFCNLAGLNLLVVAAIAAVVYYGFQSKSKTHQLPYPPGPVSHLPFLGNILDVPATDPWLTYTEWGRQYGDLVHINVLGDHTMLVNSEAVANDLFVTRSSIYSSRPKVIMLDMMGWSAFATPFIPYGDLWRKHRAFLHQRFGNHVAHEFRPTQLRKVHDLLRQLLVAPKDFEKHSKIFAGATVMSTLFGHEISTTGDRFVDIVEKSVSMLSDSIFRAAIVNGFPFLQYLPAWFPGAGFKRMADESRELLAEMQRLPYDNLRKRMSAGEPATSIVAQILEEIDARDGSEEEREVIKGIATTAYMGSADTTVVVMINFILLMVLHPEVQKKAQEQIDRVVGSDRLPEWEDRPQLPYVDAIFRETLRWHPVQPLNTPHTVIKDDVYNGYFIPKGTTLVSNTWAITRNEEKYPDPEAFKPERFFNADGTLNDDTMLPVFGFGRRLCPGRFLADASLWAAFANILFAFNITKARDDFGNEIDVKPAHSSGFVSHPLPFRCSITPRSELARKLVEDTIASNPL